ncbi:MAG: hypothetical protein BGO21_17590 [Dyadobacter sp. 50-39]|uniref:DUF5682 family protein n=1 Tax=Dyadobacter sp. 50-39 TaxID=1895756 RepID=UPI000963C221|nr:DUF5682 family protein [Dyadobacter sp. 50-39]OJV14533.1 MAG: hypothetical protein BGO21_17590 [Dyadobacter sp. 50-39]
MSVHLLGIRHHGPGSSRHVLAALASIQPDMILIEGPPEGEAMLSWVAHEDMQPPVALLAYVPDNPRQAAFYPFTVHSPEWNAIRYGLENKVPVRFIDMPLGHSFALDEAGFPDRKPQPQDGSSEDLRRHPMAHFAEIAGFDDEEEWWEHQFETAHQPEEVFEAVAQAMTALRHNRPLRRDRNEDLREAFMRKSIRIAQKEQYQRITVICGAWHVPALQDMPKAKDDNALLKNLPKTKVETTWIPWTNDRMAFESGYGAGVESPGWYRHNWEFPDDHGTRWLSHTARVFRENRVDISSAHIIEAVRLAHALAGLRMLPRPGLKELNEATVAVMCMGDDTLMKLIRRELIVGKAFGQVPEGTPQVPLQRNLDQLIRKLRLKVNNDVKTLKLDLREENDLQKSILLHRLLLLGVDWGDPEAVSGKGTFKEEWTLRWYPELTIKLLEKAPWGNTVAEAAGKYLENRAATCNRLDEITPLVQAAIPADLPASLAATMRRMDELAAGTSDILMLMNAFTPLAQVSRYGNVRNTDRDTIDLILRTVFYRIVAGLPPSCAGIDDDQAVTLSEKIREVNQNILMLESIELKDAWTDALRAIFAADRSAALIQGYCCKALYDARLLDMDAIFTAFARALSVNNEPAWSANWLEGFLKDAATVLILDDTIWHVVNEWVTTLDEEVFLQVVPLLRRTFANFTNVEKRKIASRAKEGRSVTKGIQKQEIDEARAQQVLPLLEMLMGL